MEFSRPYTRDRCSFLATDYYCHYTSYSTVQYGSLYSSAAIRVVPVESVGTDGINQCGSVRNSAGVRYIAGVLPGLTHIGIIEGNYPLLLHDRGH